MQGIKDEDLSAFHHCDCCYDWYDTDPIDTNVTEYYQSPTKCVNWNWKEFHKDYIL
jgi:hypothetical protein